MPKKKSNRYASKHECVRAMIDGLGEKNTLLGVNSTMNFATGEEGDALLIQTSRAGSNRKPYVKFVPCKYCPWCGADIYQPKANRPAINAKTGL